jgi:NAD(P)-dependent dehydrogenase (short-subunit alcohol dehydrogenase family)
MPDQPLAAAVALVTGASSGIGAATARRLARDGAAVALVARRRDRLDQVAAGITSLGGHAAVVEAGITSPQTASQAVQHTIDRLGRLDVLVNNAGIGWRTPETTMQGTETSWRLLAACRSADPDLVFPVLASGQGRDQAGQAKAVCAQCRARSECLAFALAARQVHGYGAA